MTREETIEVLKNAAWLGTDKDRMQTEQAVKMAISALEKENIYDDKEHYVTISKALYDRLNVDPCEKECTEKPCLGKLCRYYKEPCETSTDEPMTMVYPTIFCDDAISREEATAEFIKWQNEVVYAFGRDYLGVRIIQSAIDTIRQLPSIQPSRKGHWIDYSDEGFVECPFCEHATNCEDNIDELHYCFYCGAELSADMRGAE